MAEELDLHLFELARAEGEVARRDLVAEALADLGDAERDADARAVHDVLEVDEDALGRFGAEKCGIFLAAEGADDGLEHQVEFARRRQRAQFLGLGAQHLREVLDRGQRHKRAFPFQVGDVLAAQVEELEGLLLGLGQTFLALGLHGHEDLLALGLDPAAPDLIVAIAFLGLLAIDHEIMEKIVMARALPHLRIHDDGAIEADHLKRRRRTWQRGQVVMAGDHVAPPGFLDVALQLDAERAVIPEAVEAAVDFARRKDEAAAFAQRDEFFHVHGCSSFGYVNDSRRRLRAQADCRPGVEFDLGHTKASRLDLGNCGMNCCFERDPFAVEMNPGLAVAGHGSAIVATSCEQSVGLVIAEFRRIFQDNIKFVRLHQWNPFNADSHRRDVECNLHGFQAPAACRKL